MDREPEIILFISLLMTVDDSAGSDSVLMSVIPRVMSLVRSMDLDSQPKPETELMSLVTQTISFFNSMDLDSQPKPLLELLRRITQLADWDLDAIFDLDLDADWSESELELSTQLDNSQDLEQEPESQLITHLDNSKDLGQEPSFSSLVYETLRLQPEPGLISLIQQIFSLVSSINSKWGKLISLCPQVQVRLRGDELPMKEVMWRSNNKWDCLPINWEKIRLTGDDDEDTHFHCQRCNGENHKENEMAPVEIKHPLHPKHSLQLAKLEGFGRTRECYCCDKNLKRFCYSCLACDYLMNIACVEKPPVLTIDHPKWHEHTLSLFSRTTSLTCDVCALVDPTCSIYICPPCGFVVHRRCINLPRVIRISRHSHRISFTPCFGKGNWSCKVCRKEIDNDYGGYSCIKNGCSFAAHSKCATQSNIWDGIELEGEPEDIEEEEVPPFLRISDGIIQHFMHQQHYLRLDENTGRDYDENKQCHACIKPVYFGNFYSCIQCDFILDETCANLSRKMYHPVHPHLLTLVGGNDVVTDYVDRCATCYSLCTGFLYECGKEGCNFKLDMKCATIFEPLVHENHTHPLFLTSKPGELRLCYICNTEKGTDIDETFNCIECHFSLCFQCAILPPKVRYKHDKHMLALSYGKKTSTMAYWCEACEKNINPKKGFYMCDEYCCVTLHTECLIGQDILKLGSSWLYKKRKLSVVPNNECMSRPICSFCKKRCPQRIVFQMPGFIFCSGSCIFDYFGLD